MSRMRHVTGDPVNRTRLPLDEWKLRETRTGTDLGLLETLFATANGYLGMRGTPEEGRDVAQHGTFINGFHETWRINHAESAYGFARVGQTIINVPDSTVMKLYVDDEPLLLTTADIRDYERSLDFRDGVLRRTLVWHTPTGKRVRVDTERMVSFTERHLAQMRMCVTMEEGSGHVAISSQILNRQDVDGDEGQKDSSKGLGDKDDPRQTTDFQHRVLEPENHWHNERRMLLGYTVANSRMTLAVGAEHHYDSEADVDTLVSTTEDQGRAVFRAELAEGQQLCLTKTVTYHSSRSVPVKELFDRCRRTLDRAREHSFEYYLEQQREYLADFWTRTDIEVPNQPAEQQAIRWCLFQLAQCSARADQWGIGAKGLTGSGYEGHYFWDTDVYLAPFLSFTSPTWAKNIARFRVNMLDAARERARVMAVRGALYPWRTINGEEASAYYAAGTAQFHIDADVAYNITTYIDIVGDQGFADGDGLRVLIETARMWSDLGFWRSTPEGEHSFEIHGVTGPDEYTTVVNNNLFTNTMARFNLRRAAEAARGLLERDESAFRVIAEELDLDEREIDQWEAAADGMRIGWDESFGIHPQDDSFLEKEVWDINGTPEEAFPLLLNFHPLVIYRYQVLKQADVVLALFLMSSDFTAEEKRADFEYYDPITTGDSSLSAVVQSIIAAEVGHQKAALDYFRSGLFVDVADLHGNTADGVHIASCGGVWNALVHGFGGMRHDHGKLRFDPRLPESWDQLRFPLTVRGSRFRVDLSRTEVTFTLETGEELEVEVRGESVRITESGVTVALKDQGPVLDDDVLESPVGLGDTRADGTLVASGIPHVADEPWEFTTPEEGNPNSVTAEDLEAK